VVDDLASLRAETDPLERVRRAAAAMAGAEAIRDEAISEAYASGATQAAIGEAAGITGARVGQLVKGRPGPERTLLAPEPGPVVVAVVQKQAADGGQPTIATTTRQALSGLHAAARDLGLETREELVGPPGLIDLNRSNLAVLMGPRISALIAQAVSADPVIKWAQVRAGHWYLTDTETGQQYRSDFDAGWSGGPAGKRSCYAHVGRIRRPDGRGTWLYLGGAHSPGTAGAVAWFLRDMPSLWEQVRRSLTWSAIVRTVADDDGSPVESELATPVYTHGRR
jgi:hypothetical protein